MNTYLLNYHKNEILKILEEPDRFKHFSINICFVELFDNDPNLGNKILKEPESTLKCLNEAVSYVQNEIIASDDKNFIFKEFVHIRIFALPFYPQLHRSIFPKHQDIGMYLQVSGTVIRMTVTKMLEKQRRYMCVKCKHIMTVYAEYDQYNIITPPRRCNNSDLCKSTTLVAVSKLGSETCQNYQELKMQEQVTKLNAGKMPSGMWVTLDDDLVDICKPGDNITVCGIVKRRWKSPARGKKLEVDLVMEAYHVQVNNDFSSATAATPEIEQDFKKFWESFKHNPLKGRNIILESFCPQIYQMHLVKLAILVTLAGGSQFKKQNDTGVRIRTEPHLLLVGDPGMGKSQLLKFASKVISRSVFTTGVGSTSAGLTVAAVMENGVWQLEAGALVLSDGGIACIDEFNSMKEHDRTSIHEAMEQQTISVAKANIVCKLNTKCSILAATNFKGQLTNRKCLNISIDLSSPLLSRFDLIVLLKDNAENEYDTLVCDHILDMHPSEIPREKAWSLEKLQAYFVIIKKMNPILTNNSKRILRGYYEMQRKSCNRDAARTTVRLLDSLIRLAEAHAKLMFHEEVTVLDAIMTLILMEISMEDARLFNFELNIQAPITNSPLNSYAEIAQHILTKLDLPDILEAEIAYLNELEEHKQNNTNSHNSTSTVRSNNVTLSNESVGSSKFFSSNSEELKSSNESEQPISVIRSNNVTLSNESVGRSKFFSGNSGILNSYTESEQPLKKLKRNNTKTLHSTDSEKNDISSTFHNKKDNPVEFPSKQIFRTMSLREEFSFKSHAKSDGIVLRSNSSLSSTSISTEKTETAEKSSSNSNCTSQISQLMSIFGSQDEDYDNLSFD